MMEYLSDTWWIWMIVAISCNAFAILLAVVAVAGFKMKTMGVAMVVHLLSVVPWVLFVIGGIAALIKLAKT